MRGTVTSFKSARCCVLWIVNEKELPLLGENCAIRLYLVPTDDENFLDELQVSDPIVYLLWQWGSEKFSFNAMAPIFGRGKDRGQSENGSGAYQSQALHRGPVALGSVPLFPSISTSWAACTDSHEVAIARFHHRWERKWNMKSIAF